MLHKRGTAPAEASGRRGGEANVLKRVQGQSLLMLKYSFTGTKLWMNLASTSHELRFSEACSPFAMHYISYNITLRYL